MLADKILNTDYSATELKDSGIIVDYQAFVGIYAVLLFLRERMVSRNEYIPIPMRRNRSLE